MHRQKYWYSKIPLPLVLLFLLNVFLIISVELLVIYKYPVKPDTETLERLDPVYSQCTIASSDTSSYLSAQLAKTKSDGTHLIVTKSHPVFMSRAKILHAEPIPSGEGNQTVYVKNGIHTSEIRIIAANTVAIQYSYGGGIQEITTFYMVLAAGLEALELLIWYLIKGRT